jgi:NADPH:quinone reductase-like Zn-dependent oxidoreductase
MTAFTYDKYGPPQTLRMAEAGKPAPDAGEVLVKVLAISVNAAGWLFHARQAPVLAPPWDCCGRNIRSSASTLPGR